MPLTYKLTKDILRDYGFVLDHQTGSHKIRKQKGWIVVVPYKKEFAVGTSRSIIKRIADITSKDFKDICAQYDIKF